MGTVTSPTTKGKTILEEELAEAGKALVPLPSSTQQLLLSLNGIEEILTGVSQSQCESIREALSALVKALTLKELLNHFDVDVSVSVASCLSQILRIMAPDVPFDNGLLKEILQVIVTAFDNMSDESSVSYQRRISILKVFAEVRVFLLMVALEYNALIVDMFKYFLRNISEKSPDFVFASMGLIMILVLWEMKAVPAELLSILLDSVRNGNQDISPTARELAERVIESCDMELAPHIHQVLQYKGFPLMEYSKIVAHVFNQRVETSEDDQTKCIPAACSPSSNINEKKGELGGAQKEVGSDTALLSNPEILTDGSGSVKIGEQDRPLDLTDTSLERNSVTNELGDEPPKKSCITPEARGAKSSSGGAPPNGGSSAALLSTAKVLPDGASAKNFQGKDEVFFLNDTVLEGAGVINELGGEQPEVTCIKGEENIIMDGKLVGKWLSVKQRCIRGKSKHRKDISGKILAKTHLDLANGMHLGANLIGLKIKVSRQRCLWSDMGVIKSYDPVLKKHKVLYDDGNEEMLHLRRQRWKFLDDDNIAFKGISTHLPSHEASEQRKKKKAKNNSNPLAEEMKSNCTLNWEEGTSTKGDNVVVTKSGGSRPNVAEDDSMYKNKSSEDVGDLSVKPNHADESKDKIGENSNRHKDCAMNSAGKEKDLSFGDGAEELHETLSVFVEKNKKKRARSISLKDLPLNDDVFPGKRKKARSPGRTKPPLSP